MYKLIQSAKDALGGLSKDKGLKTATVRNLSSTLFKQVNKKDLDEILTICETFLEERDWALGLIAYDWAYRMRKYYRVDTFDLFEAWLFNYVRGWGDCDDFCTHAFGELLIQYPECFSRVLSWTNSEHFWVRRASGVILIPAINQDKYQSFDPFLISNTLMHDPHDLVLKGYGWMLKVYSKKEPDLVYRYLEENKERMPRVSFRYALEKMDQDKKQRLMQS